MKRVPGWFTSLCWIMAIAFSVAVGLQFRLAGAGGWIALFGAAALATAALPTRRIAAAIATLIGVSAGMWAAWQLHGGSVEASVSSTMRGAVPLAATSAWLLGASVLRALWV